jgi:RNA exonuclease NGL2
MNEPGKWFCLMCSTTVIRSALRQAGILLREVVKYRESSGLLSWPCFLAGGKSRIHLMLPEPFPDDRFSRTPPDFNFSPEEPGYALLVGDMLTPAQEERLERSRVVHVSVDPTVPLTNPTAANDDEDGGAQADPDRVITNAREASPADGLLNSSELLDLFAVSALRPRSLYDEGQRLLENISSPSPVHRCGERMGLPPQKRGAYEPEWTSYTHYWQSVLGEYLAEPGSNTAEQNSQITFGLSILRTEELLLCACFSHIEQKTSTLASLARGYLVATMSRLQPKFNGMAFIKIVVTSWAHSRSIP